MSADESNDETQMWLVWMLQLLSHPETAGVSSACGVLPLLLQPSDDMCCCAQADRHRYLKLRGLSTACRDLLTRMFRADPRQRATIDDVMIHPWFQTNLPQVRASRRVVSSQIGALNSLIAGAAPRHL